MRLLGFIEVTRKDVTPIPKCGCGRPAIGNSGKCTRCRNAEQADRRRAAKSGQVAYGKCHCGGTIRGGCCSNGACDVGIKPSRRR